jgi:hypothetical protein
MHSSPTEEHIKCLHSCDGETSFNISIATFLHIFELNFKFGVGATEMKKLRNGNIGF